MVSFVVTAHPPSHKSEWLVDMVQVLFPLFQKNITQGYVSEDEAGRRLSMVISKPSYAKSGTYWSWSNPPESEAYCNVLSDEASVRFFRTLCFPA